MAERRLNGILLIDKPQGFTSHDVVAKLRRITGERRIGHSGTLDPMATGLLVLFIGRATRAVEFAESDEKEYTAALRLGITTDTQDTTGKILTTCACHVSEDDLEAVLWRFRGEQVQVPPMYSALKQNGRKLCDLARRGIEVDRKPRRITISRLSITGKEGGDFLLDVVCSKGTYIRTLCSDIGKAIGCGGCMSALRRERAGRFSVKKAHTLSEIEERGAGAFLLPVDTLFEAYPRVTVGAEEEKRLKAGAVFGTDVPDGRYRVYSETGAFLMLGSAAAGKMSTIKSFFEV